MTHDHTLNLNAQTAVVTGAAQGIGKAIALTIQAVYRSRPSATSLSALHIECDVTDEDQVDGLVKTTVARLGRLDVMVANAGIARMAPLLESTTELIDSIHAINVKGVFYCYRAAARAMIPSGGGRIIGACSVAGKLPIPYLGAYVMSKHAVRGLTHTAAQEWAEHGITVNAYAPGIIDTNLWTKDIIATYEYAPALEEKAMTELVATRNKSTPEQIAGLVAFLVSPAAVNINGQCISVDGGWNMD
ncbi:KR domain [Rhizoctonia solani]|uniref:KR domain n=1 Tax=Rhizoctonia solani TaxID=456999 RepID=A0A8H7IHZ0_9AGAM|nr:KR domain [Rhizoctonia solani]